MTEGDLGLRTKLVGLDWWRTIFFKVGPAAASPKLQRVRLISALLSDKMTPTEISALTAPRSFARHYFQVSNPYFAPRVVLTISLGC